MITIIMMVIASAYAASSSLKPCLFSDPSSQESFWSNGPFNLSFSVSSLPRSLNLRSLLLFVWNGAENALNGDNGGSILQLRG